MLISPNEFYKLSKERPSKKELFERRLETLTGSKEKFEYYVDSYYRRRWFFQNPVIIFMEEYCSLSVRADMKNYSQTHTF